MVTINPTLKTILVLISIALFVAGLWYFSTVVFYILAGGVVSLIGHPIFIWLQKFQIRRFKLPASVCAILTLLLFFMVFAAIAALFIPLVIKEAQLLSSINYSQAAYNIQQYLHRLNQILSENDINTSGMDTAFIAQKMVEFINFTSLSNIVNSIIGVMGNIMAAIFSITFIAFFFLSDQGLFFKILLLAFPAHIEPRVKGSLHKIVELLSRYFGGLLIESSIIIVVVSTALYIAGIKNAILIGFFVGMVNIIPYVGPLLGVLFGLLVAITTTLDGLTFDPTLLTPIVIKVICVIVGTQIIDNTLMQPYIFSKSVKAHPLEIFLIILMAGTASGIAGMFLAVPVYTIFRVIAKEFFSEFHIIQKITKEI